MTGSAKLFPFRDWPVGTRVVFTEVVWREPYFIIDKGMTGVVSASTERAVLVHVDQHVPGLHGRRQFNGQFSWDPSGWMDSGKPPFKRLSGAAAAATGRQPTAREQKLIESILRPKTEPQWELQRRGLLTPNLVRGKR
ncbi:MAG: hypothetical protein ACHREM_08935 [Polyangiales bacterium]